MLSISRAMDRLARQRDDLRRLVQKFTRRCVRIDVAKECRNFIGGHEALRQLYIAHHAWLLDDDRETMDRSFATKPAA